MSCNDNDIDSDKKIIDIDFSDTGSTIDSDGKIVDSIQSLRLAVAAMTSPKETYKHYHDLIKYISDSQGLPIELSPKRTYSEVAYSAQSVPGVPGKVYHLFRCKVYH
ncbi:hypothetical protein ACFLSQ_10930 [Bacteroidota bacterium]